MGFKREAPELVLVFAGTLAGLKVVVRSADEATYAKVIEASERMETAESDNGLPTSESWSAFMSLADAFRSVLVSWNLEDLNGNATPCNAEELGKQGVDFTMSLVIAWQEALDKHTQQMIDETKSDISETDALETALQEQM